MTMTFRTALAALARIEAGTPQAEDVERVRDFVERVEWLASAAAFIIVDSADQAKTVERVTLHGLRDVLRGSE